MLSLPKEQDKRHGILIGVCGVDVPADNLLHGLQGVWDLPGIWRFPRLYNEDCQMVIAHGNPSSWRERPVDCCGLYPVAQLRAPVLSVGTFLAFPEMPHIAGSVPGHL